MRWRRTTTKGPQVGQPPCFNFRERIGALLVYDVTDLDSFEKVKTWYFELRKYIPKEAPIIIAGNKSDLPNRTVPLEDAVSYAKEIGIEHVSASAKSGDNVNYVFNTLAQSKWFALLTVV